MFPFAFVRAADEQKAIDAGAQKGAVFVAGGTNVVDLMRIDVMRPESLVDVNALALAAIAPLDGGLRIGALVKNADLARHATVTEKYRALSEAILAGASPQIRNMATTSGNLLQRTRCSYFRDPAWACNKRDPGSGCSAIDGYNRMHAVLGGSDKCIAVNPSDMNVALAIFDAVVRVKSPKGERAIPIADFHVLPDPKPEVESALQPGELVTHVDLPAPSFDRSGYVKVRDRASFAFALVSVACALKVEGGKITAARLAMGGVGTKPWRSLDAEKALVGRAPGDAAFKDAAEVAMTGARPRKHNGFKVDLAKRTIVRALENVASKEAP